MGESVPGLAFQSERTATAAAVPDDQKAVQQGRSRRGQRVAAVSRDALHCLCRHGTGGGDRALAGDRFAVRAGRRRDRAGRSVRAGAGLRGPRRDGYRHRVRLDGRAPRNVHRLSRRACAADGAVHRIADLRLDVAADDRRHAGPSRIRDLSEPRLRRRRVHDGVAGRERADPDRQSGHPSRADDDPRGDAARVFGAAPGAAGMGLRPQAVQLFVHRPRAVPAVRHRRRKRRLAGHPRRDAGADRSSSPSAASRWR